MTRRLISRLHAWFVSLFAMALGLVLVLQSCTASNAPSANDPGTDDITERLAQEHQNDTPVATEAALQDPAQAVITQEVEYAIVNDQPIKGFLAEPAAADGPLPGIIAIHEWWGLNDNIKSMTQRLAGEGYRVLAVDLYEGEVADDPTKARQLTQQVMKNLDPAQENLLQAYDYLVNEQQATTMGAVGWCFGGTWSLTAGLLMPEDLDALVIYYGQLETDPTILESLNMPIAGFFGGQDRSIPVANVQLFESTLKDLGKTAEVYIYEDADHAFANPSGTRYNPEAAADAWEKTTTFLARTLTR